MTDITRRILLLVVVVLAMFAITPTTSQAVTSCTTVTVNGHTLPACPVATSGSYTYYQVDAPYPDWCSSTTNPYTISARSQSELQFKAQMIIGSSVQECQAAH